MIESAQRWAALWHSRNKMDGLNEHIIYEACLPMLFVTRRECREWISKYYGYIKSAKDLRGEPHGWRLPRPVKVKVITTEAAQ